MTLDEIREEVAVRWKHWRPGHLQRRKFALLVAAYCRQRFEHQWGNRRRALLTTAEQIAGRTYPPERIPELQTFVHRLLDQANQSLVHERNSFEHGHAIPMPSGNVMDYLPPTPDEFEAIRLLGLSVDQPEQAAGELVGSPLTDLGCLLGVLECLRPSQWESRSKWFESELPRDAHLWARRIYDTGDFSSLPILADRLEDAGCPDRPLLDHCRCNCSHFRGCAAVDQLCGYRT